MRGLIKLLNSYFRWHCPNLHKMPLISDISRQFDNKADADNYKAYRQCRLVNRCPGHGNHGKITKDEQEKGPEIEISYRREHRICHEHRSSRAPKQAGLAYIFISSDLPNGIRRIHVAVFVIRSIGYEEEKSAFTPFPQEPFQVISQEKFIFSSYRLHAMTANDVPHMAFLAFCFIKLSCRIAVISKLF